MIIEPSSIAFLLVVSRDSVRIALNITALNEIYILACDIHNAYLTAFSEKIFGHSWEQNLENKRAH